MKIVDEVVGGCELTYVLIAVPAVALLFHCYFTDESAARACASGDDGGFW